MKTSSRGWVAAACCGAMFTVAAAQADWTKTLQQAVEAGTGAATAGSGATGSALSDDQVVRGLQEALGNGVEWAVKELGRPDGFLGDELVRIAVPDSLSMVEKTARSLGQGQYVDEFITTMNRAAEHAVPEAAAILGDAVRAMSPEDAMGILRGPDDAATQYFRDTSGASLKEAFLPIVKEATSQTGVTSAYKALMGQAGGMLGGFGMGGGDAADLDGYVTDKALDGLFTYIAMEEKRIRENPVARTSDLLQTVFGSP